MPGALSLARLIAILAPTLLLGGALISQYAGGLYPCEMCYWQRWPHLAAIGLTLVAIAARSRPSISRMILSLAAIAILASGAIGVFHAGVEYRWWQGLTRCSTMPVAGGSSADILKDIMATPLVRCDQAQWTLAGISLAGFNALFSISAAIAILVLAKRRRA